MAGAPIYQCGDATYTKQFARRADGQWFYRVTDRVTRRLGRWIQCADRPPYAWYNPAAGRARLPQPDSALLSAGAAT
ncbi:hypothetical protein [Bordetella phage vB_BbrM_PHB04]|uniref:Uncharacterized protein n=1 Tax=Bordetella phage vB_BbrM_PHB04 TaxID=2029657 RepID=A0A291LAR1_9CAUD|nr:hypothetical protein HOS14_gp089 [Bordetella phage vB_BbrM_PHB04]ATI15707.1 hypothetical protein [Bordetella phage vB_BbrM_PHB04]